MFEKKFLFIDLFLKQPVERKDLGGLVSKAKRDAASVVQDGVVNLKALLAILEEGSESYLQYVLSSIPFRFLEQVFFFLVQFSFFFSISLTPLSRSRKMSNFLRCSIVM